MSLTSANKFASHRPAIALAAIVSALVFALSLLFAVSGPAASGTPGPGTGDPALGLGGASVSHMMR